MIHISVIGLGAMGASYAAKLQIPEVDLRVIADGERADRLRREGVTINGERHDFTVVAPDQVVEPADLLIVGVKHTGFAAALADMRHHIGPQTIVISLVNGISSEAEIAAAYPDCHPLLSITFGVDAVRQGQQIVYSSLGRIAFGEPTNTEPYSEQVQWLAKLFDAAGLRYEIPADMVKQLWWKFMINTGVNQVTAILGAPYWVVQQSDSPARALMLAAAREVVAVGAAQGIDLGEADIADWLTVCDQLGPDQYTSMAQDVLAGRVTESEIFSGAVLAMGGELGIDTPVNRCLNQILQARELRRG